MRLKINTYTRHHLSFIEGHTTWSETNGPVHTLFDADVCSMHATKLIFPILLSVKTTSRLHCRGERRLDKKSVSELKLWLETTTVLQQNGPCSRLQSSSVFAIQTCSITLAACKSLKCLLHFYVTRVTKRR